VAGRVLKAFGEAWPLDRPFVIARGVRTQADLVVVELAQDGVVGRGEGAPIPRYGATVDDCLRAILDLRVPIEAGLGRRGLLGAMKPGAARNALDCALWDLEARLAGTSVSALIGAGSPGPQVTAMTVGIAPPAQMGDAARRLADFPLIKVKVNADDPAAQLAAVRAAAPGATLIADANESWSLPLLRAMQPHLARLDIALLEQPLPARQDEQLRGFTPQTPICADESCHTVDDLPRLAGLYQAINIKLDKTGGLTAALDLLDAARAAKLTVMTGCMICTSLSIAPLFQIAARADFADLDGPTWLAKDRPGGVALNRGMLAPADSGLWGG
jgi:L-alanine-DL-glutamate epimerase-like enolase superfamily enzyme